MSMICAALLNEAVNEKGLTQPNHIFDEVRKGIINALKQTGEEGQTQDGMDAALCMLNKSDNDLYFSGANNPLYLVREKDKSALEKDSARYEKAVENESHILYEIKADGCPTHRFLSSRNQSF